MINRSLGNSLETSLLIIGTSLLLTGNYDTFCSVNETNKHDKVEKLTSDRNMFSISYTAVTIATVSSYIRPTAILFWVKNCFMIVKYIFIVFH